MLCKKVLYIYLTIRHDLFMPFTKKNPYPKFLVAQNCIKKGSRNIFFVIYLRKLSRLRGQFSSTALVHSNI